MINNIFKNIDELPTVLKHEIFNYISPNVKVWLTPFYYNKYHYRIKKMIPKSNYDSYVRMVIRNKYDKVFEKLLYENHLDWFRTTGRRYYYKKGAYSRYSNFLEQYCIAHEATKCRNKLKNVINIL